VKKQVLVVALVVLAFKSAQAAPWMEDAITNAAVGSNLGSALPWGASSSQVKVGSGNLTYAGLLELSPAGNLASIAGSGGGSSYRPFWSSPVSGAGSTVFYSFLVQCTSLPTSGDKYLTGLLPSGVTSPGGSSDPVAVYAKLNGTGYQLGLRVSGGSTIYASPVLGLNSTNFIVACYFFNPGGGANAVYLFINPTPGTSAPPTADLTVNGGTAANLQNVYLKSSSGYGTWNFDTLRVGPAWADVTPSSAGPPPSTQPRITQMVITADGLVLSGTNGTANAAYQVIGSTSPSVALGQWFAVAGNTFEATGSFVCTNPLYPTDSQMFYAILVGGQAPPRGFAPAIVNPPADQTVTAGQTATFTAGASGTEPLSYQWYFNTNTLLGGAASSSLEIVNAQTNQEGAYSVVISNAYGSATSAVAMLTVIAAAPVIVTQPTDQTVIVGQDATFTVGASGTAPLAYQWYYNTNTLLAGRTNSSLLIENAQSNNAGAYLVIVTNTLGAATSAVATLTVSSNVPLSAYNLVGFGQGTTGGGVLADTDPGYRKIYNAVDLATALNDKSGTIKVLEIMNDLNLGFNEIPAEAKADSEPFREHTTPLLHPVLLASGVSKIDIQKKYGLTIFSANGATIRHATFNIKSAGNIIVRNLKFDEMWEWDESTKGDYDRNDWDFIDLGNAGTVTNIWIDHCTFTKAYDGICDIKKGSYSITFSWCKYTGDDGATNPNSWVRQQISALESNRTSYAMYNFLRNNGFSVEDIVTVVQGHCKTCLIGATTDAINAQHTVTFHHGWFINPWDRLPRLRAGNVHNYNIYVDDTLGLAARRLRDAREAAMSTTSSNTLNYTYSFKPFLNGSISTEGGAVLVEKSVYIDCLTPLRNNQTDPSNPTYTGKILALDTICQMDSTIIRGDSTDPGNPLGPFQAPIIPFSWNLPGNQLPYSYAMDDPSQLQAIVSDPNFGAGAGVLTWAKTNWLKTAY
jgi:pectate lyase